MQIHSYKSEFSKWVRLEDFDLNQEWAFEVDLPVVPTYQALFGITSGLRTCTASFGMKLNGMCGGEPSTSQ